MNKYKESPDTRIHFLNGSWLINGYMTAKVDPNSGNVTEYHTAVKIAFGVKN